MKRFYPELNEDSQSFFVPATVVTPHKVQGVLTAPLQFGKQIFLNGKSCSPYMLDSYTKITYLYFDLHEHGIVKIDATSFLFTSVVWKNNIEDVVIFTGSNNVEITEIPGVSIKMSVMGLLGLARSISDVDVVINEYNGIDKQPMPVGYELELYEKTP